MKTLQAQQLLGNRQGNAMKMFRVLVLGEHCKMDVSGDRCYMGFYVTRFVEAATPEDARVAAIAAVRRDARLDGLILNDEADPPLLLIDEIEAVSELDVPAVEPGIVFFRDEN
ncbi:MAG TPA: hypothetical protein IGR64_12505 [Leptolyngbyaceae cyanobacterium M65_K2018_010]|nr:hypothetical protein [Leptolyngbyaceae cyanobacterium M65_K2018_010]